MHNIDYPSQVLYEDNHLLIVNKPSGRLVQGDRTGDQPLVDTYKAYIKEKYHKPGAVFLGVIHRLDRPVSGVLAFAKTSKALDRMNQLFRSRNVRKIYWAVVTRRPVHEQDTLTHWLRKDTTKNKVTAYAQEIPGSKEAVLHYRLLASQAQEHLLEVEPLTGRPHQIRVQLASIECVIKGDVKYGADVPLADGSIGLLARQLIFMHPVKKVPMQVKAPLPRHECWQLFSHIEP